MAKIFISAAIPTSGITALQQAGYEPAVYQGSGLISHADLVASVADAEVLITPLSTQVDRDVIDHAPKLKLIANFGAGFNNIDVNYAANKAIAVTNTPGVSTASTAEVTVGLVLALMHRMVEGDRLMRTTGFNGWAPLFFLGHELQGKTLGIIGMGAIGQAVAKRLHAFGMKIVYTQRRPLDVFTASKTDATELSLEDLLKTADVVSLHVPLTHETQHMLGADQLALMKPSAYLINAARGPLIDEQALLAQLQQGQLAGAALDVYETEPKLTPGFADLKNVVLTPHIGNATVEARDAMAKIVTTNAIAVLAGQAPQAVVNGVEAPTEASD
ncbi:NAD(P)-dependent oxidoreductase [Lactiplantibacillus sp. WILCCON 0030]|uniref:NAD(P)-dependent oxidoreductase n=1 Tax=Lactiplantibacillus brownii TaxID=3069269 RepID=A0ABU1AC72_9LACO|nr:NAD(P)-dependent oxidoreductase [Lactiplantibacillus brownii]MDQ7938515.1 NAD(P)-dependent oxidoreductase [Lactiplantibacillus brownii]